jgi:hypothetical protein
VEAGVAGMSVDALLGTVPGDEARFRSSVKQNLTVTLDQLERMKSGAEAEATSRINAVPTADPFATTLKIGAAVTQLRHPHQEQESQRVLMAKQRLQVSSGLQPAPLRPQASPVDTFTRPNAGSRLGQLADALSGLAPSVARFSDVVAEQQNAKQQQAGILAAQKAQEEGKTYREAIQQGVIRPDQSPWFRMGAQETFGRVTARKYVGDFLASEEYQTVADSTDPRDFDKAEQAFRKRWSEENVGAQEPDQHYQLAFNNQAEATLFGLRENFAEQSGARLVKLTGEAYHAEVFQTALDAAGQHLSPQETADSIILARERQFAAGHTNRALLNQLTANAIVSAARG